MKTITINLTHKKVPFIIGGLAENLGRCFENYVRSKKTLIVTNPMLKRLYGRKVTDALSKKTSVFWTVLPAGESSKNLDTVRRLYEKCVSAKLDRNSAIVALGGGVVGDIAGFAASTIYRGIKFVQIPTTLLAMVDSSIGGKVGVDLPSGKNLVGSFWQPELIFADTEFLKTLPEKEIVNGLAEVIKYGVISDAPLFRYLEKTNLKKIDWHYIVERCAVIKAAVVEKDEMERKGIREILNFGHTVGHAIESLTKYKKYTHGEAVAIGMVYECILAEKLTGFGATARVRNLIDLCGLPVDAGRLLSSSEIMRAIAMDKKVRDGKIRIVLPAGIGKPKFLDIPLSKLSIHPEVI